MATTIKDIAKYAGVGIGTVSRVLNGETTVKEDKRKKVEEAMAALSYIPNRMASRLRKNENGIIALLVPVINHPFFSQLAYYVEDEADKYNYSVMVVSSQHRVDKETQILDKIRHREIDGAVFVTHHAHSEDDLSDLPIVSIDRSFGENIPYVTSDNYNATARAIEYLIDRGCKKIGYIGSKPIVKSEVMERERAYRDVMNKHGLELMIQNERISHGEESSIVASFLEKHRGVDGVFASGYTMAQVFYDTAMSMGVKIPDDVQLISYDGSFRQWSNNSAFTCIEQPIEEMSREVVRLLLGKIHKQEVPSRMVLKTSFILGLTTK